MSTHQDRQLDVVLSVLEKLAKEFRIRECDLEEDPQLAAGEDDGDSPRGKLSYL